MNSPVASMRADFELKLAERGASVSRFSKPVITLYINQLCTESDGVDRTMVREG